MIALDFSPAARKFLRMLKKSQPNDFRRICKKLDELRALRHPEKAKKLVGGKSGEWRVRLGGYRIFYRDRRNGIREVTLIAVRQNAYRH